MPTVKIIKDNEEEKVYRVGHDDGTFHLFLFNKRTGQSLRLCPSNPEFDPFWSPVGPELLDICITERCNRCCPYCYQAATSSGEDMPLELYKEILTQAHSTVCQVALGGGEVVLHHAFCEILRMTREDFGIVPNYTTNGDFLNVNGSLGPQEAHEVMEATKKYCGAIAVSAHGHRYAADDDVGGHDLGWEDKAIIMAANGVKTNIHFILGEETVDEATELLRSDSLHKSINAVVFLLYKPVGRGVDDGVLKSRDKIEKFLEAVKTTKTRIGFDACGIPMLVSMTNMPTRSFDTCEGGRFSGYVHTDGQVKACSFDKNPSVNIKDKKFADIWTEDLATFRDALASCACDCQKRTECYGGCPLAPQIVICYLECRK